MVAFRGVVVDDIEDHFDAGGMQRLHHRFKLADRSGGGIARLGGKKSDGVITPVVPQTFLDKHAVVNEAMHRHQLHGRNTQPFQIIDYRGSCQSGIGSPQSRRNFWMQFGEALDVYFVNHALVPGDTRWLVCSPSERRVDHDAFEHAGSAVAAIEGQIFFGMTDPVAKVRITPPQIILDLFGVRIQQELMVVKAVSVQRIIRTVDAVTVQQSGTRFW